MKSNDKANWKDSKELKSKIKTNSKPSNKTSRDDNNSSSTKPFTKLLQIGNQKITRNKKQNLNHNNNNHKDDQQFWIGMSSNDSSGEWLEVKK
jgi:hypothetical protein